MATDSERLEFVMNLFRYTWKQHDTPSVKLSDNNTLDDALASKAGRELMKAAGQWTVDWRDIIDIAMEMPPKKMPCSNCGTMHSNFPNWYCQDCSKSLRHITGHGFLNAQGVR